MLEEIRLKNIGVIADATLRPDAGLTALTGETGAGKTMVLTSFALLQGQKVDAGKVRAGCEKAEVEADILAREGSPIYQVALDNDAYVDDGLLLAVRTLVPGGRSRAFLGGRAVPLSVLENAIGQLLVVHGQSQQIRLCSVKEQRRALDRSCGEAGQKARDAYALARRRWALEQRNLVALEESIASRHARSAELRKLLARVAEVSPELGEDEKLRLEIQRLANAETYRAAVSQVMQILTGTYGSDSPDLGFLSALQEGAKQLRQLADSDSDLKAPTGQLEQAAVILTEVSSELTTYLDALAADPHLLEQKQQRRAQLLALAREFYGTLDEVIAQAEAAKVELDALSDPEQMLEKARAEVNIAYKDMCDKAADLSLVRAQTATKLAQIVETELKELGLAKAHFVIDINPLPEPGPHGGEDIEFTLSTRPQMPQRPLNQGASGGELSRLMLALELSLAKMEENGQENRKTFVFDEVDSGIGGQTASAVGRRLAQLAKHHQVIVVTHLAQVAAFASKHVVVSSVDDRARLNEVEGKQRLAELARMLSGEQTQLAISHAEELLNSAKA